MWGCDPSYDPRPDNTCFSLEPTGFITVKGWMPTNVQFLNALQDGLLLAFSGTVGIDERSISVMNIYADRGMAKIEVKALAHPIPDEIPTPIDETLKFPKGTGLNSALGLCPRSTLPFPYQETPNPSPPNPRPQAPGPESPKP